ncbi:MAG TPA: DinB family protein [Chitinophagaceae bacterium]|nr:DinB family protein [Chitinophagaceae bacterium]
MQYQHQSIRELVNGLTGEQLHHPVNPGKWSVHQNIAHLYSYQPVFLSRIKRIIQENEPAFERHVADTDPAFLEAAERPTGELVAQLGKEREEITAYLLSMEDKLLERVGLHPKYGRLTVVQWLEFFLLHEAHHLFTIFMLTSGLRTMQVPEITTFTK